MSEEEYLKLIQQYGKAVVDDKIIDLNLWKGSKGKKTKSDYMTIISWIRKDGKDNKGVKNGTDSRDFEQELREQGIGL
jgi:two-component SAPR family response regulator